jgi:pyruvate dehydrogenase E2 component (dihydrolipoamide acetyltransferase)
MGGSMMLCNIGGFDIDFFTSIINPPETAILSMAKVEKRPVVIDDRISIRPVFNLGLAVDHRVVDGAQAASFLQDLRKLLINPYMLFRD